MSRRGTTLFELMVALTVAGILTVVAIRAELLLERALRSRAERAGAAGTLRAARAVLKSELAAIGRDSLAGSDIRSVAPGRVEYRGDRGLVAVCRLSSDSIVVDLARFAGWRARDPAPGRDSLLILVTPDSAGPEGWIPVPLLSGPALSACPGGGPAVSFGSLIDSVSLAGSIDLPTAGRFFETVAIESYGSGATWQVGLEQISALATLQPFAGPIDGAGGLAVAGLDRLGSPTALAAGVAGFDLTIRALARREVAIGRGSAPVAVDSVRFAIRSANVP